MNGGLSTALVLFVLASGHVSAQQSSTQSAPAPSQPTQAAETPIQAYHAGSGVTPPKPVYSPDPDYSDEARQHNLSGTCVLELIVDADGRPQDVHITRSLGMGLDEKAVEAVQRWKFEPGMKDGTPVATFASIEISFSLNSDNLLQPSSLDLFVAAHLSGVQGPLADLGKPKDWGMPKYPPDALRNKIEGQVILLLTVGKNGRVKKVSALRGDPTLSKAASDAVRKWWKFAPPLRDGKPVEAHSGATIKFSLPSGIPDVRGTYYSPKAAPSNVTNGAPAERQVFHVGGGVSAPRVISAPGPQYDEKARKAKYQGVCVLSLIVTSEGTPRDVRIVRSLGMGLDEKAIEAVSQWKFEPGIKDGKPVAVMVDVEVNFHLY